MFSMGDEYVPEYVDKKALVDRQECEPFWTSPNIKPRTIIRSTYLSRLCTAMGGAEKAEIEYGNHSLSNRAEEAVQAIIEFIKRDGPKGWDDPWS